MVLIVGGEKCMQKGKRTDVLNVGKRNHYLDLLPNVIGVRNTTAHDVQADLQNLTNIKNLLTLVPNAEKRYKLNNYPKSFFLRRYNISLFAFSPFPPKHYNWWENKYRC